MLQFGMLLLIWKLLEILKMVLMVSMRNFHRSQLRLKMEKRELDKCHSANYLEAFLSVYLETNSGSNSVMGILNYCCPAK